MTIWEWGDEPVNLAGLDLHFGRFAAGFGGDCWHILLGAALVSMVTRNGHSCLELREWAGREDLLVEGRPQVTPALTEWCDGVAVSPAVGNGVSCTPLVLEGERLYLARYWAYEKSVSAWLAARGKEPPMDCDEALLVDGLSRWFPDKSRAGDNNNQRLAALLCLLRRLAIITGGPGTGKTTTVARILALLVEQFHRRGALLRVALAAPTGKAAMRLRESIALAKAGLDLPPEVAGSIPDQVVTIHRLLGATSGMADFKHDEGNPLPFEVVVVDEMSMVDLPLMAKLLRAMPTEARLILLGDRHQLSSVEPGSVLGDLCQPEAVSCFSRGMVNALKRFSVSVEPDMTGNATVGLADSLVELSYSHRFDTDSGIGRLGAAVRRGEVNEVWQILTEQASADVVWREISNAGYLAEQLSSLVGQGGFADLANAEPDTPLASREGLQVLCALKRGPFGADQINDSLERTISGRISRVATGRNYPGRPVMVLRNDYDLGLYNGDVGVVLADALGDGGLKCFFPALGGSFRKVSLVRLPPHQSAYAMTVHKSQGSEFGRVVLILPDRPSLVLSRELLFTAITRAKSRIEIWGNRQVLELAIGSSCERRGGLRDKLWGRESRSHRW